MPNFIHSLDASNVHLLFKFLFVEYGIIISVYTVHDYFANTVNNIELLKTPLNGPLFIFTLKMKDIY
jgi:hypothetical protein